MKTDSSLCGAPAALEMLMQYYNRMVEPKPFVVRTGESFQQHQRHLRAKILECVGLSRLPERIPLEVRESKPLEHPWCRLTAVTYQLWPGIRARAFLYRSRTLPESPTAALLSPVGHWQNGNAHPDVQARCLNFARLGYTVLCTTQHHYEDLPIGFSHQTLMIWNNMRGLDLLESMEAVDRTRIGCAGASGGGLQTQMLVALDERVRAATIVGITCDYREILFPYGKHCVCNHWPRAMQFTDQPEIAALALPRPIQFLTMDDWTKNFERDNVPKIRALYDAHGIGDRVDHRYWPTPHLYDKPKRERTYWWMERWLKDRHTAEPLAEPDTFSYPPEDLLGMFKELVGTGDEVLDECKQKISGSYRKGYEPPGKPHLQGGIREGLDRHRQALRNLLGLDVLLPRPAENLKESAADYQELRLERWAFGSEGSIFVPTLILHDGSPESQEILICCDDRPKEDRLCHTMWVEKARSGCKIVFPDVRFVGALSLEHLKGRCKAMVEFPLGLPSDERIDGDYADYWTRNGILWGRPLPGMAAGDLLAVLDGVLAKVDAGRVRVSVWARGSIGAAALFAACLDDRIGGLDLDIEGRNFTQGSLPLVPGVLRHGDIEWWRSLATSPL